MNVLESDLEEIIFTTPNKVLSGRDLPISGIKRKQLKIGNYGRADVITVKREEDLDGNRYLNITVFELKKEKVGISAFLQALRYCKGIQIYLESRKIYEFSLNIVLVGKTLDYTGSFVYLPDLITHKPSPNRGSINAISFYTYKYNVDGIYFNEEFGYSLIEGGF